MQELVCPSLILDYSFIIILLFLDFPRLFIYLYLVPVVVFDYIYFKVTLFNMFSPVRFHNTTNPTLRSDFTSKFVHGLAFGTPKFYIEPYGEINQGLDNLSYNCDVKSDLKA